MGRIASDVLVRGTHWAIGCCVLYSLRVLSLAVVSVTLLTFLCPLYLLPFHSMFTLDLYSLCLIVFLAHPTLVALLHLCLSLTPSTRTVHLTYRVPYRIRPETMC
ncbi:hypothetical protein CY34DRAFT_727127 [Suillus luteus UH-Slu-Lm8-n1]|uniref:Unplaced genomic scaffold CY34scaffold_885, whole genome shotgun sequence n=1 Tax=Suillus luteus UH-Slu-Lm8-n1 TaxID=930992 RepID=A0A0D0A4F8_9AGAM|nr:hypothetical protein CY34DRAFT_727127 [Suillus luteus UH-Slu-Lm8-n1]